MMAKFDIDNRSIFYKVKEYTDTNKIPMRYYVLGHAHPVFCTTIECNREQTKQIKRIINEMV